MNSKLKTTLSIFALATALTILVGPEAHAAKGEKKQATCKVATNDIGTIIGRGPSSSDAFEDAATQCFERRAKLFKMKKGSAMDEDTGLTVIDVCANISCG